MQRFKMPRACKYMKTKKKKKKKIHYYLMTLRAFLSNTHMIGFNSSSID